MSSQFPTFSFREAYDVAAHVRAEIFEEPDNGWLYDFSDLFALHAEVRRRALAPRRETLLHLAIDCVVDASIEYDCDKLDYQTSIEWIVSSLESHEETIPAALRKNAASTTSAGQRRALDGLKALHDKRCASKIATEAFTLLFGDREFLLRFNERIADEVVSVARRTDHPGFLARDGVVKRFRQWPTWLRRALLYRDNGHCAVCLRDLSGTIAINADAPHIDHIVPLEQGGTNDPTNLQLLCKPCNLKKDTRTQTSRRYMVYW